jgi:HAD superfamily hydrolase (TIGR01549 family)
MSTRETVFLFDLDGTLIDNVYEHVLAWKEALAEVGIVVPTWRLHRKLGMSGGLFVQALMSELGRTLSDEEIVRIRDAYRMCYRGLIATVGILPGAGELLEHLTNSGIRWAIVTSAHQASAQSRLAMLKVPREVPVITRDMVAHAKPDPDLFLAAAEILKVETRDCIVVGDSIWDMIAARRAQALSIGFLSGGYSSDELIRAGAYQVFEGPADMLARIHELGARTSSVSLTRR